MRLVAVATLLMGLLLAACGQDPVAGPVDSEVDSDGASDDAEGEDVVEGTLGGDARLEGGCAWLDTDEGRFEVRYPQGYDIAFEPVRLLGPDGDPVAEEGETVRVRGRVAGDLMTVCQVGPVFQASEVLAE